MHGTSTRSVLRNSRRGGEEGVHCIRTRSVPRSSCARRGVHRTSCDLRYSCARGGVHHPSCVVLHSCARGGVHLLLSVSTSRLWQVSTQHQHQLVTLRLCLQSRLNSHLSLSTSPAPVGDAAPAPVVEYITPAPMRFAAPAPVDEYSAPAVKAEPAPVVKSCTPATVGNASHAPVYYVAPAPIVDVLGPQFHEHIAETSRKATSSGGRVRKSARLSPNGPEGIRI